MAILDFPPSELSVSYGVQDFTIGQRLVTRLVWQPGATATGVFFSLESCTGSACSGFTEFVTDVVFPYVDSTTGLAHYLDGYSRTLSPSTIYRYRVRNQYAGGYSTYSNIAELTLPAFTPPDELDPGTNASIPLAPSLLSASGTTNAIDLTWLDNANNEDGFILQRHRVDPGVSDLTFNWVSIASIAPNTGSYSDTGLAYETLYYYRILAFNQYGTSVYSNITSYQTAALAVAGLAAPIFTSATAEFIGLDVQVVLVWVDNSTTETAFIIERKGTTGNFQTLFVSPANSVTFTDTQVARGSTYNYRIRAYRSSDTKYSPYSSTKTVGTGEFTGTGQSRTWDGTVNNYIEIIPQGTFGGPSAQCAWVRPAVLGTLKTIFGNRYDAGYAFQIDASDNLTLSYRQGVVIYNLTAPLTIAGGASQDFLQAGVPLFVACNITDSTGPVLADFYAGTSAETVQFIGSDSDTAFVVNNGVQHVTLGMNMFGLTPEQPWNGELDRIGCWSGVNLSLSQLRAVAVCGATPPEIASLSFFFEITGADPELTSGPGADGTIIGTLPVTFGLCTGTNPTQLSASGYAIAHQTPDGVAATPSSGGVIRDNQMSNNAVANLSANIYTLSGVTIDNPGAETTYIRRGVVIYE